MLFARPSELPRFRLALAALFLASLAACGGGGTGSSSPGSNPPANGGGNPQPGNPQPPVDTPPAEGMRVLTGVVTGARGAMTLSGPNGERLVAGVGAFSFRTHVADGAAYAVTIAQPPAGQDCALENASGNLTANSPPIQVNCVDKAYALVVNATVAKNPIKVANSRSGEEIAIPSTGVYRFAAPVAYGSWYTVVVTDSGDQACTLAGASRQASGQDLSVDVTCSPRTRYLSGVVTGVHKALVLTNIDGQTVSVPANGGQSAFKFPTAVAEGAAYNVTIATQPVGQTCTVHNGSGTASADVSNIVVDCGGGSVGGGGGGGSGGSGGIPAIPASLTIGYAPKLLQLSWPAVTGAQSYIVLEDPDGPGPLPAVQVGAALDGETALALALGPLHMRLNARYAVAACSASGCSTATTPVGIDINKAIGYFKASNNRAGARFGWAAAMAADGKTLVVSAPYETSNATGVNGNSSNTAAPQAGAAYVYAKNGALWTQQAYLKASNTDSLDRFGSSVSMSADGNTIAVGAEGEASAAGATPADNSKANAGAAYVFSRSGSTWSQQAYLKPAVTDAHDAFGFAVALSADGNWLAVGAPREDSAATGINGDASSNAALDSGAVYVFNRAGFIWMQQAYVKASNTEAMDQFGLSLALSGDGSTLAVGATGEASKAAGVGGNQADNTMPNAGAAYVFARAGAAWNQQAYVKASNPGAGDLFGQAVALSNDGSVMAVGAPAEAGASSGIDGDQASNAAPGAGAAYVFSRAAGVWSQKAYVKASNTGTHDGFGARLSLSSNGQVLAVGALGEAGGSQGLPGSQSDNSAANAGAVYVFEPSGATWAATAYLKASNSGTGDSFGTVAVSGDGLTFAVGAHAEGSTATGIGGNQASDAAAEAGALYLY